VILQTHGYIEIANIDLEITDILQAAAIIDLGLFQIKRNFGAGRTVFGREANVEIVLEIGNGDLQAAVVVFTGFDDDLIGNEKSR